MKSLLVPADLFLEMARIYKTAPQEATKRSHWILVHRLECVAEAKVARSRAEERK